jgi:thioredoxin 1
MKEIIKYGSSSCGPCKMMTPIVQKLCADENIKLTEINIDLEENEEGVTAVPTLILKEDGKEVNRVIGLQMAPAILAAFNG